METEASVIEARFRDHDPKKSWRRATLRRVVEPPFADPFAALIDERTGGERSRPLPTVEVRVTGARGGRRWVALTDTELAGGEIPMDARPVEEDETE